MMMGERPAGGVVKGDRQGIDIREQINQGFVRSELGTVSDDKSERIYSAASVNPVLLERHATSAIDNYVAAISCFLRAIPSVKDVRSKKLIKAHVDKLMRRLGWMRQLLAEAQRLHALNGGLPVELADADRIKYTGALDPQACRDDLDEDLLAAFDALMREDGEYEPPDEPDTSGLLPIGTAVEVCGLTNGVWEAARVIGYTDGKYKVKYDSGLEEENVEPNRVRLPRPKQIFAPEDAPRIEVMSEIVESERQYNLDLYNLNTYYVHKLKNPAHWGGEKEKEDSWFTQKTLNEKEEKLVFANVEDIIAMNRNFLNALEEKFAQLETDQSLATTFVQYAPKFKLYAEYVVQYEESQALIAKMKKERMGFKSADEAAERQKVAPLATLMKRPVDRTKEYIYLLQKLKARTPEAHPSNADVDKAILIFNQVNAFVQQARNMKEHQKLIHRIEEKFKPSIGLVNKSRVFLYEGELNRMEERNSKQRHFWLFNDILVCGRPSEWLARGSYRHLGTLHLESFGSSDDYGLLAFYVKDKRGETWHLICKDHATKSKWLEKLALCRGIFNGGVRKHDVGAGPDLNRKYSLESTQQTGTLAPPPPPPPPPPAPRGLPPGWVELVDQTTNKSYYFNQSQNITQWERPTQ